MTKKLYRTRPWGVIDLMFLGLMGGVLWLCAHLELGRSWDWNFVGRVLARWDEAHGGYVPGIIGQGLPNTLRLALWSMVLASLIGLGAGLARVSKKKLVSFWARGYVELVRNTPPLVLIFVIYFFLAGQILTGLGLDHAVNSMPEWGRDFVRTVFSQPERIGEFLAALVMLAVYEGAYIVEIVRSGIQSVESGQWEAAYALGLTPLQSMRTVILPQALRRIAPALAGQFISTIKDSAIVSVISIPELTFEAMELSSSTTHSLEVWSVVLVLYLSLCLLLSVGVRLLERAA